MKITERARVVQPSTTLAITARAKAMSASGVNVISFSAGEPDFDTAEPIKEAARTALRSGQTKYTPVAGTLELRQAVARWHTTLDGRDVDPDQVIVSTGAKQVLFNAIVSLVEPGDAALVPAPYWLSYPDMVRFAGARFTALHGTLHGGFLPSAQELEAALTPDTRLVALNSPNNPTGAVYTRRELEQIAKVLRQHPHVTVITDDIYGQLVYDEAFVSIAHVAPDLEDRMLIVGGVSKAYAMTGWRIGFGVGPKPLIGAMTRVQGASTSGPCSIAQAAALQAVSGPQGLVESQRQSFKRRRDRMIQGLRDIPDIEAYPPGGAFYVLVDVSRYLQRGTPTATALCEFLLEHSHVATVPGEPFGAPQHIRLSFACSEPDIDEGLRRIRSSLGSLRA